jgi:hypothetical protein
MAEVVVTLIAGPYAEKVVADHVAELMNRMLSKQDGRPFVVQEYPGNRYAVIVRPLYAKHNSFVVTYE